jgi:predicted Rossmann fold nucleotide-binding protein DprA/Smf involved in DNA uptake
MDHVNSLLPPGTQTTLLLCASFGQHDSETKPLTLAELNRLESALAGQQLKLADLADPQRWTDVVDTELETDRLRSLLGRGALLALAVERWTAAGLWVVTRDHADYPARLRQQLGPDAPPLLYGVGEPSRLSGGGVAVVGSRDAAEDALTFTRSVAERCAHEDIAIISGGARGIDAAATAAVLEAGGQAVAILADSLLNAATVSDYKPAIRDGQLTLATPHDPDARFTVWRAMDRNKCLYSLADFAVVVQFTTDKGGTWGGAVEHLKRADARPDATPVLLRIDGNPPDGVRQLLDLGAVPFPQEAWDGSCQALLTLASRKTFVAGRPTPPTPDFYAAALPLLQHVLREPRDKASLQAWAADRRLSARQLDLWLKQAIDDGYVKKKGSGKSLCYVAATQTLFDRMQ